MSIKYNGKRTSGKKLSGKRASGKRASGKRASGKRASGKRASGKRASGKKLTGKKLTGKKLTGKKLSGKKLTGKKLSGKRASGKKLSGKRASGKKVGVGIVPNPNYLVIKKLEEYLKDGVINQKFYDNVIERGFVNDIVRQNIEEERNFTPDQIVKFLLKHPQGGYKESVIEAIEEDLKKNLNEDWADCLINSGDIERVINKSIKENDFQTIGYRVKQIFSDNRECWEFA
jgi:hypothetical protein